MTVYHFRVPALPSVALSPNARVHWRQRYEAMVADKNQSYAAFLEAYPRLAKPLAKADVEVTVIRKRNTRTDLDNWAARMKGFFDGLVDVGLLADDNTSVIKSLTYQFLVDKERGGCVEVRVTGP